MSWLSKLPSGVILEHLLAFVAAFVAGALATRVVIALATRWDFVSRPRAGRWSTRTVALGGGVAIYLALVLGLVTLSYDLLVAASAVFLLGLIDDRRALPPRTKLVVQTIAGCYLVWSPLDPGPATLVLDGPAWLTWPLTVAWFVGMANSVNLLDNMDGSAAGVAAVAGGFLYALAVSGDAPDAALAATAAATVGAAGGFLLFNFPPARVFMGDAGSLLLGFVLAGLALRIPHGGEGPVKELAVAAFVLGIPLFDTALVWLCRRAAQRPFLQGGRDHTTHRLMALGLSERRTVLVVYGAAAALGGVGLAVARGGLGAAVLVALMGGLTCVFLGLFLGEIGVYRREPRRLRARNPALFYALELGVDLAILTGAWIGAYALRFQGVVLPEDPTRPALGFYLEASAVGALPFVLAFKLSALLYFELYRGIWQTIRFRDALRVAQAITVASVLIVVAATILERFENYSLGVIAIDWLLSLLGILASRSALRLLRDTLGRLSGRSRRALWLGPGSLRPLLETGLGESYQLVGRLMGEDPAELLAQARAQEAEVLILGEAWAEDDPRLVALRAGGLLVRRAALVLE